MEQLAAGLNAALPTTDIEVVGTRPRREWVLVDLRVHPGGRRLFAKVALPEDVAPAAAQRPRLLPVLADGKRLASEAKALSRLAEAIPSTDPDLAAVPVVHYSESPPALVVDWVDGRPLSAPVGPVPRGPHDPAGLLRKAGRWLQLFHSLSGDEPPAYDYPDDVLKWLGDVEGHLGRSSPPWSTLVRGVTDAVERHDDLRPLVAVHHGDMAARNLMVRPDGRIVGIDAGADWQAPRSHDLAAFVIDLEVRAPHRTRRRITGLVDGYGYRPGASRISSVFLSVALIDRYLAWLARVEDGEGAPARRRLEGMRLDRLAGVLGEGWGNRRA